MFSPVKTITAGALIFAVGGVFLIAQPFDQQGGVVPGAVTDTPGESTSVTGTSVCTLETSGTFQLVTAPYSLTGHVLRCTDTASDPRVAGTSTVILNIESWERYGMLSGQPVDAVSWTDFTLVGPDGTWNGHGYGFYDTDGLVHGMSIATGNGAYEGLTYTQSFSVPVGNANPEGIGLIQTGSAPPGFPTAPFSLPASE